MGTPQENQLMVPPHNVEAEQSVLGAILTDPEAFNRVAWLHPEDFYRHDNQIIFRAIRNLPERAPPDIVTVGDQLGEDLEEAGGTAYLANMVNNTPTSANVEYYAQVVRAKAILRGLIGTAGEIVESAQNGSDVEAVVDQAERRILEVSHRLETTDGYTDLKEGLQETIQGLEAADEARKAGHPIGLQTGIQTFDNFFGGLHRGDLIIIAGRPSMGKSALAQTWARNLAHQEGVSGIHSAEQPGEQIHHRWLAQLSGVSVERFRSANMDEDQWTRVRRGMERLYQLRPYLHIHDSSSIRPAQIARHGRRLKAKSGLELLVVDYLQILEPDESENSRREEIEAMSRAMKNLARELDVAVVLVSQLTRAVEQRPNKRPLLSDLRESGSIEQDADMVLFPYRPAYYGEDAPEGLVELHAAKNRQGPTGYVECAFVSEKTLFADLDQGS